MFEERTVFILGAGASAHCGLPLGFALNKQIKEGVADAIATKPGSGLWENLGNMPPSSQFLHKPYHYLLGHLNDDTGLHKLLGGGPLLRVMGEFSRALAEQTNFVIDQFLVQNPEFAQIGKLCIAVEIIRSLYKRPTSEDRAAIKKPWAVPINENWYAHFINQLHAGAVDARDLEERTQVSIISFNYDHTLEDAIREQFAKPSRVRGADYRRCIDIIHPHGCIVSCGDHVVSFSALLKDSVERMSIIDEVLNAGGRASLQEERERAKRRIAEANKVYILGFGFHPFNIRILDLHRTLPKERAFALNHRTNSAVDLALKDLGIPMQNRWAGEIYELFSRNAFAPLGGAFELSNGGNGSG
jgi:hypothetical protein